jgi:hypothetical protein
MTKKEALKILDEVMASIRNEYLPDCCNWQDWESDLLQVFNATNDGELEVEDEC